MPEGEWIPLLTPTAVILVILQGRKLCEQVFMCTWLGPHSSTSSCSAGLSVPLDHIWWDGSAGRSAAERKLLLCLMWESPCSLLAQVLGQFCLLPPLAEVAGWSLCSVNSRCSLPGAWKVSGGIVAICGAAWPNFPWLNLTPVSVKGLSLD